MALVAENANLRAGMKLALEPTFVNGAAFAHRVDAISDIVETALTEGELTDTPHHTDSHRTSALARSEQPTHQQPCEKTSTPQPVSKTW
ncbi:hypothetical protein [Rhodococcus sp. NPDC060176]|uniref:hypothetical protein n=1 Tax=Rhodococcus sp. NPDC060176 TaxID=3347062 RepID=UPI003658F2B3